MTLVSKGINGFSRFRVFFWEENFGEKNITHSKFSKSATSLAIVSSEPIVVGYLFQLTNKISQIRSILISLMR